MLHVYRLFNFPVPVKIADEVMEIYKKRSPLVAKNQGFIRFLLLQNEINKGELLFIWNGKQNSAT